MQAYVHSLMDSPIGRLMLVQDGGGLGGLYMENYERAWARYRDTPRDDAALREARHQLDEYFAGRLQRFTLKLNPQGSAFQCTVWRALSEIPFGETSSYGELARRIGQPTAARAVGLANGQNPLAVIVPCHRVIGANGSLTGYGGGLPRKRWLLEHEAAHSSKAVRLI